MAIREQILEAALRVYGELGYRGATTRRIAEEAGVNEVTLFRHFGSKRQLIHEAVCLASPARAVPALPDEPTDPGRELREWSRAHLRNLYEMRSVIRRGMSESEEHADLTTTTGEHPRRVGRELGGYLARVRDAGLSRADVDPRDASLMLMGVLFADAMSRDVMPDLFPRGLEESADRYVGLFLRALGAEKERGER